MKKILKTLAFVGMAAMVFSCSGKKSGEAAEVVEERVTLISTAEAVMAEVPQTEVYSSTVEAYAVNNIAPQAGGRIQTIRVDVGSFVGKGQVLAIMDAAQLDQTRLKLINDSTELSRLRSLYEEGGVSKSDYDAVEMAYNVSRRSYNNLAENTYLRSPISGVVTARNYDKGDLYNGQPIDIEIPVSLVMTVTQTEPGIKGDTVSNVTKPATLETGVVIQVPIFVNEGDRVKVDTRTREYLGRD